MKVAKDTNFSHILSCLRILDSWKPIGISYTRQTQIKYPFLCWKTIFLLQVIFSKFSSSGHGNPKKGSGTTGADLQLHTRQKWPGTQQWINGDEYSNEIESKQGFLMSGSPRIFHYQWVPEREDNLSLRRRRTLVWIPINFPFYCEGILWISETNTALRQK